MPYKDKTKQKAAVKKAVNKHRGITEEGITKVENLLDPPAILSWLIPGEKREKLGCILEQFGKRKPLLECTYICGIPLDEVTELYDATG